MITVKGVAIVGGIAALGAVSAAVLTPPARADDTWAAIAYSPSAGVVGGAANYPTREGAEESAMQACANRPPAYQPEPARDCKVAASGTAHCFALAVGPESTASSSGGYGATIEEAKAVALLHSRGWAETWFCQDNGEPKELSHQVVKAGG